MSTKEKACDVLLKLQPTWITCAIAASGISCGLAVMWNPKRCTFKAYKSCAGIILSRYCIGTSFRLCIFNICVPYNNKKAFWDRIDGCGILDNQNIIVPGDLNLIMEARVFWGQKGRMDPLADYFKDLFNRKLLMGIVVAGPCQVKKNKNKSSFEQSHRMFEKKMQSADDVQGGETILGELFSSKREDGRILLFG